MTATVSVPWSYATTAWTYMFQSPHGCAAILLPVMHKTINPLIQWKIKHVATSQELLHRPVVTAGMALSPKGWDCMTDDHNMWLISFKVLLICSTDVICFNFSCNISWKVLEEGNSGLQHRCNCVTSLAFTFTCGSVFFLPYRHSFTSSLCQHGDPLNVGELIMCL